MSVVKDPLQNFKFGAYSTVFNTTHQTGHPSSEINLESSEGLITKSRETSQYTFDTEPATNYSVLVYRVDWALDNLALMKLTWKLYSSAEFCFGPDGGLKINITLSINKDNILFINIKKANDSSNDYLHVKKHISICFLNRQSKVIDDVELSSNEDPLSKCHWKKELDVSKFVDFDSLPIRFFIILRNLEDSTLNKVLVPKHLSLLCEDMTQAFGERNQSADIKVFVGGREFLAHRAILYCQSSYFAGILKQRNVLESVESDSETHASIELEGDSDMFNSVLAYMYTGKVIFPNFKSVVDFYRFVKKFKFNNLAFLLKPQKIIIRSKVNHELLTYNWNINNFLSLKSNMFSPTESPVFECRFDSSIKFRLLFYRNDEYVRVALRSVGLNSVETVFKISVSKNGESSCSVRDFSYVFNHLQAYPSFLKSVSQFNVDCNSSSHDSLRIRCVIYVSRGEVKNEYEYKYSSGRGNVDLKHWASNFDLLLKENKFSDTCLQVGHEVFNVHKVMLSARSPVFCKMFEANMSEGLTGHVKIEDIDSSMMEFLLKYIYTGEISNLKMEFASDIFHAAEKYELLFLKDACSKFMKANIDLTNACELFTFGDLYGDEEMKKLAKNYIFKNSRSFISSAGQDMIKKYPDIVGEIFDKLSEAYCSINK